MVGDFDSVLLLVVVSLSDVDFVGTKESVGVKVSVGDSVFVGLDDKDLEFVKDDVLDLVGEVDSDVVAEVDCDDDFVELLDFV